MSEAIASASKLLKELESNPEKKNAFIEAVSDKFQEEMKVGFSEGQLIAMDYVNAFVYDADICASHDYCDANMIMDPAFISTLKKEVGVTDGFSDSITDFLGDGPTHNIVCEIWGEAWWRAKERGFSSLWTRRNEIADAEDLMALARVFAIHPIRMTSERRADYPSVYLDDPDAIQEAARKASEAIERNSGDIASLAGKVREAILAGDEATLISGLEEFAASNRNPTIY